MKRGNKFLTYSFISVLCFAAMFFFGVQKASAASEEYTCYDRGNNLPCTADTVDGYYVLERLEVLEGTTTLTLQNEYGSGSQKFFVEKIYTDAIVVVDNLGNEVNTPLNLTNLVLPSNLLTLETGSLRNISSLDVLNFPSKLMYVGSTIFDDGAHIDLMTLNHYGVIYVTQIGSEDRAIFFEADSFSNASVGKFVCGTLDVYDNVKSHITNEGYLQGVKVTAALNYNFYKSEKAIQDGETPLYEETYYIGETLPTLPEMNGEVPAGLNMLGWYLNSSQLISNGSNLVVYQKSVDTYQVYPKFSLKDLTFDFTINTNDAHYTSENDLVVLNVENIVHELVPNNVPAAGFNKTINWRKNGTDLAMSDVETLSLKHVSDTGVYECVISYSYLYEGITYTGEQVRSQTVSITPVPLYIDVVPTVTTVYGTYLTNDDLSFKHMGLLGDDEITAYAYTYHNSGNIQAGTYANEIQILIQSIINGDDENVTTDYNIIYTYGTHIVSKKDLGAVAYNDILTYDYGSDLAPTKVFKDENVYGQYDNDIEIVFSRVNGNTVNTYEVNGIVSINNNNYTATFDDNSTGYVNIERKQVMISYTISANVYDGKEKNVNIYYTDIKGVRVSVEPEFYLNDERVYEVVNAGIYYVIVRNSPDDNYTIMNPDTLTFVVSKANPVVRYAASQEFIYTGEVIRPVITINNDEQKPSYVCSDGVNNEGDYCVNVGIYTVNVNYPESANYLAYSTTNSQPIRLGISKYAVNINPKSFEIYYDEYETLKANLGEYLQEVITINGEDMLVKYTAEEATGADIGKYDITRATIYDINGGYEHPNYSGRILLSECVGKIHVLPRPITIHYYGYSDFVYDGKEKDLKVYLFDKEKNEKVTHIDIATVVDEGVIKNAGVYHASSTINDSKYVITNSALISFEVKKGTYDVSAIKFKDAKFTLDFKKHSIEIEGALPEGVGVEYTVNGKSGNSVSSGFENIVIANFVVDLDNYNPIEPMQAVIRIDMSWLIIVIISIIVAAGVGVCIAFLYASYRRDHPRKIKLKIKTVIQEDLAAKRVATSVKEVLGDEEEKKKLDEEIAILESEDDLDDDAVDTMTFIERIYAANSELKYYYSEVKNELLSYEGITHTIDRKFEIFYHGTRQVAKLSICNGILRLYVNLDPQKYDKRQYNQRDMSKFECHEKTPLRINVNSLETLRHAKVFIRIIRKKEKLEAVTGFVRIDYEKFYTLKENFIPKIFKNVFIKNQKNKDGKK